MPACALGQNNCCCPLKRELKSHIPYSRLGEGPVFFFCFLPAIYLCKDQL